MSRTRRFLDRQPPSFAHLCVLTHHVLDRLGPDFTPSDVVDELKWDCARAGFGYPTLERFTAAFDAVMTVRRKGYRTPRRPAVVPMPRRES